MITLGLTASIPYMALALILPASGRLADYLIAKKGINSTLVSKSDKSFSYIVGSVRSKYLRYLVINNERMRNIIKFLS